MLSVLVQRDKVMGELHGNMRVEHEASLNFVAAFFKEVHNNLTPYPVLLNFTAPPRSVRSVNRMQNTQNILLYSC